MHERFDKMPFFRRMLFKGMKKMYTNNGTPFGMARKAGRVLGGYFVKKAI